ncbi:MAG: ATP-grasp domain-containing protein [Anaerotignum sp.]|nr:ATP-grasp domain-containing protein [Anaerotignum sp.]
MKNIRVWFNHWFSTAYHIIHLLKDDEYFNFVVVGSNTDSNCVYRAVCDEWVVEPKFDNSDKYVDYCLDFCKQHKIDVFAPRRNMLAISRRIAEFDAMNVLVLVERDYSLMSALFDKAKTYEMFTEAGIGYIPPHYVVKSVESYQEAYKRLKTEENRVCIKFTVDEGAVSFRVIDDRIRYSLTSNNGAKISYENSIKLLSEMEKFPSLIVMPYLSGPEVSVDCFAMPDGKHIAIPRYKSSTRSETIQFEEEILQTCQLFLDKFKLKCPCNLQFRYDHNTPYLLEVNTRMSGGTQLSCKATGVNIPNMAVNRLLGIEKQVSYNQKKRVVSFIETPVILE